MGEIKYFSSCYRCEPPKRHPGCHATCPEYIEDRKAYDTMKEAVEYEKKLNTAIVTPGLERSLKRYRKRKDKGGYDQG